MSRYRLVMAAMLLAGHLVFGLNLFAVAPLLPLAIEEYQISRAAAGLLVSLPMLVAAAFGIPGGMLVARIGVRRSFLIGWAAMAILVLSLIAPNFGAMLALRLAYGVGLALMVTATGPLLMQWFPPREVLVINSLNTAIVSLGVAASVAGAAPLAEIWDWKAALTVFALVGVLGFGVWAVVGRDGPIGHRPPAPISLREAASMLRGRTIALLVAADAGFLVQYTALTGWLPTFYNEHRGLSLSEAGFLTGILPFVGIFGVLAGGILPMRFTSARGLFLISGLMAGLGALGTFLLPWMPGIYVGMVLLGFGSWFYVPTLLTLPLRLAGMTPERLAVFYGSIMTFSGIGMFIAPILVGAVRDGSGSFFPGFAICAAVGWLALLAGVLLPRQSSNAGLTSPDAHPAQA